MSKSHAEASSPAKLEPASKRLQFELFLELGDSRRPFAEAVRRAASSAGGELLFALPAPDGNEAAIVRLPEDGADCFVQVRPGDTGFVLRQDGEIDADILGFARASVDVLERLKADQRFLEPLAAATH